MEKTYLYMVHPRKVITGLSGATALRSPKSLLLTKEDVKICLQRASVYRRFAMEGINVRVTIDAVDRLHNDHFIPEDKWDAEKGVEIGAPVEEAPVVEEVKEEAPVVEEPVVEENNQVEEVVEDVKEEELTPSEEQTESSVEESIAADEPEEVIEQATEEVLTEDNHVAEESAEEDEKIEEEATVEDSTVEEAASETPVATHDENKQQFNYQKKKKH